MTLFRWIFALVLITLCAGVLLSLRHQRLMVMNETIELHRQMDQIRQQQWDIQVQIAEDSNLDNNHQAIEASGQSWQPLVNLTTNEP